jgi:hypothetical protein
MSNQLRRGIQAAHAEANGLLGLHLIAPHELHYLIDAAMAGDALAAKLTYCVVDAVEKTEGAPRRKPVLCIGCGKAVKGTAFSVAVILPEVETPENAVVNTVCPRCAKTPDQGKAAVLAALQRVWPSARCIQVTHEDGGHV